MQAGPGALESLSAVVGSLGSEILGSSRVQGFERFRGLGFRGLRGLGVEGSVAERFSGLGV